MAEILRDREEIPSEYKWNLEDIFPSQQAWDDMYGVTAALLKGAEEYQGRLTESGAVLASCLVWANQLGSNLEELYTYARMKRDEDNRDSFYQGLADKATILSVQAGSALSFIVPELLAANEEVLNGLLNSPELKGYEHYLDNIVRKKAHVLTPAEEKLLAESAELAEAPGTIFAMMNNADLKFGEIEDEEGRKIELTKGNYSRFMESSDRGVRKDAFQTLYAAYGKQINAVAAMLGASIKSDCFYARVRKYPSALAGALYDDNVPQVVYDSLLESVHAYLPVFYRYIALRKKILGVEELRMYDVYTPLIRPADTHVSYEEAKAVVREGLKPLGEDYLALLEQGYRSGWIDVYENAGKTSGGYSWGTYRSHPYVLLNHQDTLDALFTLAHEMGHALHTYYSGKHQPYHYAGYKIFVAEVASTLNESLVIRHMIDTAPDAQKKAYLINHYLDQFRGTVFRQTMFAEFEKMTHEAVENGLSLTVESLSAMYGSLNEKYYGPDMMQDEEIKIEWARIPHFYNSFYVYKYATGFSAATALASQIQKEGKSAVDRYLEFLSGGGSDYPLNLLRKAGVDMAKPEPVQQALDVFSVLVNELEQLLG